MINRRQFLKVTGLGVGGALLGAESALASGGGDPAHHYGMLYDATRCIGCNACTNACRDWNNTTPEVDDNGLFDAPRELSADTWTLIQLYQGEGETSFVKRQCMHCVDPACASACPASALQKLENGAVVYDRTRCIGCRYCMVACPFQVPRFEWDEVIPIISKCNLCSGRLELGRGPSCAEACPAGALVWGKRDELLAEAESRIAANPDRYQNHVYGKDEVGGTSVLYLSGVPFEKLGLPELESDPPPELSEGMGTVILPSLILGGPLVLAGINYMSKKQKGGQE
jgi:formate dehydrogenase beta subunit